MCTSYKIFIVQNNFKLKETTPMEIKTNVSEIVTLFKEVQKKPSKMFELIRTNIKEQVSNYI
jgi:hypothetical protein